VDDRPGAVERNTSAPRGAAAPDRSAGTLPEHDAPAAHAGKRAVPAHVDDVADAQLATLVADSQAEETAAVVRVQRSTVGPRLLSFECPKLAVEVEVDGTDGHIRMLGQVIPAGSARIEVRQEHGPERRFVDADRLGRFVVEDMCAGSTSMTCHRVGERPVTTDWASL
jgi:hypothetical protein